MWISYQASIPTFSPIMWHPQPPWACWAGASIFYILHSTLILPVSGEGRGCWGCCCCCLLWERTRSIILLQRNTGGIYSNNLVCTDHVCSCLVTSAAWEWIDQSHDCQSPYFIFALFALLTSLLVKYLHSHPLYYLRYFAILIRLAQHHHAHPLFTFCFPFTNSRMPSRTRSE